jgi:O-antigen ligase
MFLLPAVLGPLIILSATASEHWAQLAHNRPLFFWSCLASLALIGCHYLVFTISPDVSFIPSLLLACLPLWGLSVSLLKNPQQLWVFLTLLVGCFALFTTGDFLYDQQRAHAPLRDPGNYLTLLYLVGIPWLLFAVRRKWSILISVLAASLIFVCTLAMLATHMRFGMLVVGGMLSVLLLAMLFRFDLKKMSVLVAAISIAAALVTYTVLDLPSLASTFSESSAAVNEQNPRMLIWQSTLQAVVEVGGINGTGLYTFSLLYPLFRSPLEQGTSGILVHNDLLQFVLEGGIWLALPLLLLFAGVSFNLFRRVVLQRSIDMQSGILLALVVAFVHSSLNFVFYVLPLVILVGVMLAMATGRGAESGSSSSQAPIKGLLAYRVCKTAFVGLLAINILFLCLDVLSIGVFSGNKLVPGASLISSNATSMQTYAQWAQTLNARRGVPVFVEARLLEQKLDQSPSPLLMSQTDLAYRTAIGKDPWNLAVRISYVQFRNRYFPDPDARVGQESDLYKAFNLNRTNLNMNLMLYRWHETYGSVAQQKEIAANIVLWCELMGRDPAAESTFREIEDWATSHQFAELADAAQKCQAWPQRATGGGRKKTWFMRWMESTRGSAG